MQYPAVTGSNHARQTGCGSLRAGQRGKAYVADASDIWDIVMVWYP